MEKEEARKMLREMLPPGSKVFTTVLHVSRSGMSRTIRVAAMENCEPQDISPFVAYATGLKFDRDRGGVKVGGCGMDMCFQVVYELSHALYPDGFECVGERCPSNDHSNGDRNRSPHHHGSGGYALTKRDL
jgi:hypothetical protein